MSALDTAHAAMMAAPDDDAARLAYYARLADGELVLLLEEEAAGEHLTPQVFDLDDGPVVLVFDSEERLAAFTGTVSPYAVLPGRVVAQTLAGQGVGLGVNLGAPSQMLLPAAAVDWLAATLGHAPAETEALPSEVRPPEGLPEELLRALDAKLARAGGLATGAVLAAVGYAGGRRGHLLAFLDAAPGAEAALARAASEALTFSGIEAGEMDVVFPGRDTPLARAMLRVGLRVELPAPQPPAPPAPPAAPGMDPARPPILRR